MTHTRNRKQRRLGEAIFGAIAALLTIAVIAAGSPASAGDVDSGGDPVSAAGRPHCDRVGPGSPALADSDGCVRIRGYIAAGDYSASDRLLGGRAAHFDPFGAHGIVANVRASGEASGKAPTADRFFTPEGQSDLAR
jgi:hypothetical protein